MEKTAAEVAERNAELSAEEREKAEEIERLRQTEKPTIPSVIGLSLIALLYVIVMPPFRVYQSQVLTTLFILNVATLLFQIYVVPSRYYSSLLSNLEPIVFSVFAVAIVLYTGGFNSPFFFTLYLILLSTPINQIVPPLIMASIQEIFLSIGLFVSPEMMEQLYVDPIRCLLLFFSPLVVTYFVVTMLYETLTQKREKEKAEKLSRLLTEEKKKLETVVGGIGEMVVATDDKGVIELVNGSVYEIMGIKDRDLVGSHFARVFKTVDFDLTEGGMEVQVPQASGEPLTFRVRVYPVLDSLGLSHGKVFVFHDVTSEKELERMKIDFVSMSAHELRTPLTILRGYLSLLKSDLSAKLAGEQKTYLERCLVSADSLSSLVDNLLNIARIERGNLELSFKEHDLAKLFEPVAAQFAERCRQKEITFEFEASPNLHPARVDEFRIGEVLVNLLDNAFNFTPKGGKIKVTVKEIKGELVTAVADNGEGIPESSQKRLFTKFYRAVGLLSQGSKGTGLGLYICKSIVEMHQGRIWFKSKVGSGSTFYFALPVALNGV